MKNKKGLIGLLIIIIAILVMGFFFFIKYFDFTPKTKIANPASEYCVEQGHKLEIREGEQGQYGVCISKNGNECDEWEYFRTECGLSEDDCVRVDVGCCSCENGGTEVCVKKSEADDLINSLNCDQISFCATVFNCNSGKCTNVDGECQFVE